LKSASRVLINQVSQVPPGSHLEALYKVSVKHNITKSRPFFVFANCDFVQSDFALLQSKRRD
jgi:hypothetical protein